MSLSNTEKMVKDIRRNTRRKFSTEEKIVSTQQAHVKFSDPDCYRTVSSQ